MGHLCVCAVVPTKDLCSVKAPIPATAAATYISSQQFSSDTPCQRHQGGAMGEWTIQAQPGQTINISLIDFEWQPQDDKQDVKSHKVKARRYGYLLDKFSGKNISVTGNSTRERHLLVSNGSSVHLVLNVTHPSNYLIKFQGNVHKTRKNILYKNKDLFLST